MNANQVADADGLARWLVRHAARSAPPDLSARLEEEWLADLESRRGGLRRLSFGIGCCWATRVIAGDYSGVSVAATASARGYRTLAAHIPPQLSLFSRRTTIFLLIAGLHVALIYLLMSGLAQKTWTVISPLMQASVIEVQKPHELPPPPVRTGPSRLVLSRTLVVEPPPLIATDPEPEQGVAVTKEDPAPSGADSAPPPPTVIRIAGGPGSGFPNTNDYYPAASERLGESGVAAVRVCVDTNGRLTSPPSIAQSSGSSRIDEGALRLAQAGSGHYRPTTEDARPVSSCYAFRIRFNLRN
jgi:TonB family protein